MNKDNNTILRWRQTLNWTETKPLTSTIRGKDTEPLNEGTPVYNKPKLDVPSPVHCPSQSWHEIPPYTSCNQDYGKWMELYIFDGTIDRSLGHVMTEAVLQSQDSGRIATQEVEGKMTKLMFWVVTPNQQKCMDSLVKLMWCWPSLWTHWCSMWPKVFHTHAVPYRGEKDKKVT